MRPDNCDVTVDREGWFEVELAVNNAMLGMCAMDDSDWPYTLGAVPQPIATKYPDWMTV